MSTSYKNFYNHLQYSLRHHHRTIREQILMPFIIIIIVLPIIILVSFNIAVGYYSESIAVKELKSTKQTATSLMKANQSDKKQHDSLNNTVKTLASALTASKLSGNTDFFLISDDQLIYPLDLADTLMTPTLRKKIIDHPIPSDDKIYKKSSNHKIYYMTATTLPEYEEMPTITMLFISDGSTASDILKTLNAFLIIAILFSITIAIIIYLGISKRISTPIKRAATLAKRIGNGDFVSVPIMYTSEEIYQLTYSINDMSKRLKETDNVQKKFLQNASHELRTPLMSIQGYAEAIINNVMPDNKMAAEIIRSESIRLNKLVDELLTLSRIENQTYKVHLESLNLSVLIPDFIRAVNGFAMKQNIFITYDLPEYLFAYVDEGLMSQIIINILSNCIRYANKNVTIKAFENNYNIVIKIIDDGKGFSSEDIPHIFDRFYKGKGGNFGLGLSIAKSAIEFMDGIITIHNSPNENEGAVFEIRLPRDK